MSRYLSRFKGLLSDDRDRSWRSWAAQKLQRKPEACSETLVLFPGWATRRYHPGSSSESAPFDIEASVSGYATSCRTNAPMTRSQRAFIRIAKGFAALPRITDQPMTPDENFNPLGDDLKTLEQQFRSLNTEDSDTESSPSPSFLTAPPRQINTPLDVLQKLHCNLESRVQLFWSSCLSARTVRLHLFASPRDSLSFDAAHRHAEDDAHRPIATVDVLTGVDGSFNARVCIPWEKLCEHHRGVYIAYGLPAEEHDLVIVAELLPPPVLNTSVSTPNITSQNAQDPRLKPSFSSQSHTPSQSNIYLDVPPHVNTHVQQSQSQSQSHPHLNALLNSLSSSLSSSSSFLSSSISTLHSTLMPSSTSLTHTTLPITHSPIRIISDIDDTVKMSGITEGARAVFHNVFVKELKDGIIPGMGEWYTNMWERGVRFHYVSNGPFEYLSILHEFFSLSKLPPGSIKLKSYAGRSLLSGLLSAPAARKRAGVIEILDSFPDSQFILIGDSGEQDLELYADLAREREDQILAVFIRDADEASYAPIQDPTGWDVVDSGEAGMRNDSEPLLDYSRSSSPASEVSSPWLGSSSEARRRQQEQEQQMTPRAKLPRRYSGQEDDKRGFATPLRRDKQIFDENSVETLDTPTQKSIPLFQSPTITPSTSRILESPKPMERMPLYISTPPPPIHPLRLPFSSSSSSSSNMSPPLPPRPRNPFRQNGKHGVERPRAVKAVSEPPPLVFDINGRVINDDDQYERLKNSTSMRTTTSMKTKMTDRINTIGPSLSVSGSSSPLPYVKPSSRLSFPGFGGGGHWNGGNDGRRVASANNTSRLHEGTNKSGNNNNTTTSSSSSSSSSTSSTIGSGSGNSTSGYYGRSEGEKKRAELQMRVYTARTQMPSGVLLRVFRDPGECGEDVERILGE
ncbi:hypothetical protein Agabi119p4_6645 [Agaricus bisporus var. burnettii]|uniref:Phosphatidate phosphatase APP1 catalytic domain-containing protein n=1 Tax=Agaricus bisporus var. burnettii TaxID=192524 RepID=A0A8H7CBB9_AGABI|nr:hypothetical protein Agabi119p4_6645 [Agaricus bisporus var. burnettii]